MNTPSSPTRRAALAAGLGSFALLASGCGERGLLFSRSRRRRTRLSRPDDGFVVHREDRRAAALADATLAAAQAAVADALADVTRAHVALRRRLGALAPEPAPGRRAVCRLGDPTLQVFDVAQVVQAASGGAFDVASAGPSTSGASARRTGLGACWRRSRCRPCSGNATREHSCSTWLRAR